jgi:FtsH-binding integral membrane protein
MKKMYQLMCSAFLVGGVVFAVVLAAFDFFEGKAFNILKFVLSLCVFGLFMALYVRYKYQKQTSKNAD